MPRSLSSSVSAHAPTSSSASAHAPTSSSASAHVPTSSASPPRRRCRRGKHRLRRRCRSGCGESSCAEWAIVELQGVVQPQSSFTGDIRGLYIGRLCSAPSPSSSSSKAGYTFTVGYHKLAGMKVTLKKPLLMLRKKKARPRNELKRSG